MGGVVNHIKASMLHLLKVQRDMLAEGLNFKYTGENWAAVFMALLCNCVYVHLCVHIVLSQLSELRFCLSYACFL